MDQGEVDALDAATEKYKIAVEGMKVPPKTPAAAGAYYDRCEALRDFLEGELKAKGGA